MKNKERVENLLEVYTFEEILEQNDIELWEVISYLYEEGVIDFPTEPVNGGTC